MISPGLPPDRPDPALAGPLPLEDARYRASRLVARNTMALVFSQFITPPVSIVVNAMLARSLGASDFGAIYLATTVLTVGFLLVEWGGQSQVAGEVARNRPAAATIFGTGLLLRFLLGGGMLLLVSRFADAMAYDAVVRTALTLCGIRIAIASLGNLCSSLLRGFERLQWHARATVFANLIDAALVIPTLLSGGGLRAALPPPIGAAALALAVQISLAMELQIGPPRGEPGGGGVLVGGGFGVLVRGLGLQV